MKTYEHKLWTNIPEHCKEFPTMIAYIPEKKKSDMAIIILPGGGYCIRSDYEGDGYARFLAENGYTAFVVNYRVAPNKFPLPLLDARRAIRTVRFYADKFNIDKKKIAIMGSSAGGHLAALCSTFFEPITFEIADEIDEEDFVPNFQILCYPVISLSDEKIAHFGSAKNLLGDKFEQISKELSPNFIVSKKTPPAFIWHTFADQEVNVKNSLIYAQRLKDYNIPTEVHIFPDGRHGLGLATESDKASKYVSEWSRLLLRWLNYITENA